MSKSSMEDEYDFVILGTGLQQCILADKIAKKGLKVLQIDRNRNYGSDLRTLNYLDLCEKCATGVDPSLKEMNRKFNIDITPKFLLADGLMKNFLVENDIQNLVSFTDITGHFVYKKNRLHAIPHNEKASLTSGLISLMQKPKVAKFFWSVRKYSENKEKVLATIQERSKVPKSENSQNTIQIINNLESAFQFHTTSMKHEFEYYGLSRESIDLIGHAIALNLDDSYLARHPSYTYDKIYFYVKSLVSLNGIKTPFIYPLFGISELCQAFSRRAGMSGCIFMLNTPVLQIQYTNGEILEKQESYEEKESPQCEKSQKVSNEKESGSDLDNAEKDKSSPEIVDSTSGLKLNFPSEDIKTPGELTCAETSKKYKFALRIYDPVNNVEKSIYTHKIISETSYFPSKTKVVNQIITGIFIIKGNVPLLHGKYKDTQSAHVLFLANEIGRKNDVFMAVLGEREQSTPDQFHVCIITTIKETQQDPIDEVNMCLESLGNIVAQFVWCRDLRAPDFDDRDIIMVRDVDETTHLESLYDDFMRCSRDSGL